MKTGKDEHLARNEVGITTKRLFRDLRSICMDRHIERLLLFQPKSSHRHRRSETAYPNGIPALTTGLLVLSLAHLRQYGLMSLPVRSRSREGFLEDIEDHEDHEVSRSGKLRIIDRVWKSWGKERSWYDLAGSRAGR